MTDCEEEAFEVYASRAFEENAAIEHLATVLHEIERIPGFEQELRRFAEFGSCSITPPILGAMGRVGMIGGDADNRACGENARYIVAMLDAHKAQEATP